MLSGVCPARPAGRLEDPVTLHEKVDAAKKLAPTDRTGGAGVGLVDHLRDRMNARTSG